MAKIILFGGSFDPIHNGHLKVAAKAKLALKADRVIFVLARTPRWKESVIYAKKRLDMLKIALNDYPEFEISLFEYKSKEQINYTIDTIAYFKKLHPRDEIFLLIGFDQLEKLHDWRNIEDLAKMAKIVAYGRNGAIFSESNAKRFAVTVLNEELYDVSSTDIRNFVSVDVPIKVLEYIVDKDLYFIPKVRSYLTAPRFSHSVSVAFLALRIAAENNLDYSQAFIAGLLHDIGKEAEEQDKLIIMKTYYPDQLDLPRFAFHQFVGHKLAHDSFGIRDEAILNAIKYHATGRDNMGAVEMIIYAADKIEPLRGFDSSSFISCCLKNYELGFIEVLKDNKRYLINKGLDISNRLTQACMKYYLEEKE